MRTSGATDGRSRQVSAASAHADAIAHWRDQQTDGRINLAALHGWLVREHGYAASLKSVQRYWRRTFPAPAIRARRRVETPAGAQAQVDWAEYPGMVLGGEVVDLVALVMTLSWSRKRAVVWARAKDMLSWTPAFTGSSRRVSEVKLEFQGCELSETAFSRLCLEPDRRFCCGFPDSGRTHPIARARSWKISRSKL